MTKYNAHRVCFPIGKRRWTKNGLNLDIFEIKATQTLHTRLFSGLDYFTSVSREKINIPTLIYGGTESQNRTHHSVRAWMDIPPTTEELLAQLTS